MALKFKPPFFVALDVDDRATAIDLAQKLRNHAGGFKIGPRLTYRYGESLTRELAEIAPVFVDNKYHDIPSTMLAGIQASFDAGATLVTVHASAGPEALKSIAELGSELNKRRPFQILCVTVLTSLSETCIPINWRDGDVEQHVLSLSREVYDCGLRGIVCSPNEVSLLRRSFPDAFLLTPGIRLPDDSKDDQSRIMGPREAVEAGSSALVIGRPIVAAKDPVAAAQRFIDLLQDF